MLQVPTRKRDPDRPRPQFACGLPRRPARQRTTDQLETFSGGGRLSHTTGHKTPRHANLSTKALDRMALISPTSKMFGCMAPSSSSFLSAAASAAVPVGSSFGSGSCLAAGAGQFFPATFLSIPRDLKAHAKVKVASKNRGKTFVMNNIASIKLPGLR